MHERIRQIDIIRGFTILLILIYHSWVVCGSVDIKVPVIDIFVRLGGEIGVTMFFMLSGYGIYCSIRKMESKGELSFDVFIKKRAVRILPQYYVSLIIVILFMSGAYYLSKEHIWNIISHFLLIHNLFPQSFGAINGVLWTMGVITQFYVISIPLYKGIKKWGVWFGAFSVIVTIVSKMMIYIFLLPILGGEWAFFCGRQLLTALDNFVLGMLVAFIITKKDRDCISRKHFFKAIFILGLIGVWCVCKAGIRCGIHTNNICGYVWHSLLAICLSFIIYGGSFLPLDYSRPVEKSLLWAAKYEYGIYLWHLVMFNNLYEKSSIIQNLITKGDVIIVYIIFIALALGIGYLFSVLIDDRVTRMKWMN